MIDANQIPPEVVEAAAKAIYEAWCAVHGVTKTSMPWEEIDDEERQACIAEAIASIAAALNSWPGSEYVYRQPHRRAVSYSSPAIILPLPQEASDE